jgi:hypothetical protein
MTVYLNPALAGMTGSTTRQRLDNVEFRISLLWLPETPRIDFQPDPGPPPLVFGEPGLWMCGLSQADGTLLLPGQALRHGVNFIASFRGDTRFPGGGLGQLLAWDLSGQALDPGRDDLDPGTSVRLVYIPA